MPSPPRLSFGGGGAASRPRQPGQLWLLLGKELHHIPYIPQKATPPASFLRLAQLPVGV